LLAGLSKQIEQGSLFFGGSFKQRGNVALGNDQRVSL
jgi:hypothetical protein